MTPNSRVLIPVGVTRRDGENPEIKPVDGFGVLAPIGCDITGVMLDGQGNLGALILQASNAIKVWHPLFILPLGHGFTPTIGRNFGRHLGTLSTQAGVMAVFQDLPWPTSALEAATGGNA